jgi:O-antigen/teichoic acid export membrane protein
VSAAAAAVDRADTSERWSLLGTIGTLIASTGVTSGLGVAFWWLAAHRASLGAVGNGAAAVSAMTLAGTFGMIGLNTALIPHLARRTRDGDGLLAAGLSAAALVSGVLAAGLWLAALLAGGRFASYLHTGPEALVFIGGSALTGASLVLDEALLGLLGGAPQLWRNSAFAVAKLAALAGFTALWHDQLGTSILTAWVAGTALSLAVAATVLRLRGVRLLSRPRWAVLRGIGGASARNTWLNNALQAPGLAGPMLVTGLLGAEHGGAFYVAYTALAIATMLPFHFTTALYAANAADPGGLAAKLRFTLRVCLLGGVAGVPLMVVAAHPVLHVFGAQYAARATLPLIVMAASYFGSVLKNHYVALLRIADEITTAAVYATVTGVIRLAAMAVGGLAGGLLGVSVALLVSSTAEGLYTIPALRAAVKGELPLPGRRPGLPAAIRHARRWPMNTAHKTVMAVAVMAAGVLLISVSYAAGRAGASGAGHGAAVAAFWLGEAVIFAAPAAVALGRRGPGEAQAAWLAVVLATATYLVKYFYSPSFFAFPDEFLHVRTLTTLQASHHLFGVNYALPVSPGYPGLEIVTSGLMNLTGLGVFPAGLIVAGLAHLVCTAALYWLFRLVGGSSKIGLTAVIIYAANPHYQVFDAIFGYQTLALAFFALALLAMHKAGRPGVSRPQVITRWVLAAVFTAATAATHHITSFVLVGAAAAIAAATLLTGGRKRFAAPACFAAGAVALVTLWTWRFAPGTVNYLSPALSQFIDGVRSALAGHSAKAAAATALPQPAGDKVASYALALLLMAVIPVGWRQVWRTQRDNAWALALAAGAAAYYPCVALPLVTAGGSELAGRLLTFVYVPVGYTVAVALTARPLTAWRRAAAAAGAAILLAGGIAMGWPPWWERLPGSYVVDGFESGVTTESVAAANWADLALPPGQRIAADYTNNLLFGTIGNQSPVNSVAVLYCSGDWSLTDTVIARQQAINYLVVDLRTSEYRSANGSVFQTADGCAAPLPRAYLSKFDAVPGMTRVYDSGNIIVYRLSEAGYAP